MLPHPFDQPQFFAPSTLLERCATPSLFSPDCRPLPIDELLPWTAGLAAQDVGRSELHAPPTVPMLAAPPTSGTTGCCPYHPVAAAAATDSCIPHGWDMPGCCQAGNLAPCISPEPPYMGIGAPIVGYTPYPGGHGPGYGTYMNGDAILATHGLAPKGTACHAAPALKSCCVGTERGYMG